MRIDNGNGSPPRRTPDAALEVARVRMVDEQIRSRGIQDPGVLGAMIEVPRHLFVSPGDYPSAYDDNPLPIGYGQTISQPYIVALMTEALRVSPRDRVLEIGTGSGYQAAILSRLAADVFTIESVAALSVLAEQHLGGLGCTNVHIKVGDGYNGWPEEAPFQAVIVTAAPESVPQKLLDQLADDGRMVIPVGVHYQDLLLIQKVKGGFRKEKIADVRFVPMVGGVRD